MLLEGDRVRAPRALVEGVVRELWRVPAEREVLLLRDWVVERGGARHLELELASEATGSGKQKDETDETRENARWLRN